ncbi:MAG TPA: hypothetical protein ENI68_12110 [Gammaproteobacteria bacterium]|nr:hypothetical protein [Gammaproteobacteria bacterium]
MQRKTNVNGLLGMSRSGDGFVLAKIQWDEPDKPRLCLLESVAADGLVSVCEAHKLGKQRLSIVMEPGDFSLQLLEAPQVADDEMRDAVRWKIKDQLDYELDQAVLDVFEIPGLREQGRTPQIYAVYAHKDQVCSCIERVVPAGMALQYIDIPELVQRNIACRLPEDESGLALLNLQQQSGLLTLTYQSTLFLARELDSGYQALAGSASNAVAVNGSPMALMSEQPTEALETVALEIQRSLDYYESHFGKPPIKHLLIAPLVQPVPELLEHIRDSLGLNVRMLDLAEVIDVPAEIDGEMQARAFYAIGAALRLE